MNKWNC